MFYRTIERGFCYYIRDPQTGYFILSLDLLGPHQDTLIAVREFRHWECFTYGRFKIEVPDVNSHTFSGKRADQPFNLLGPMLHRELLTKIRPRLNLIRR